MTNYQPGSILTLETVYYVYELLDDHGLVFYVGISRDPGTRFRSHANPKHCDRPIICETIAEQRQPRMRICSVHETRQDAERAEIMRIKETPGVLNEKGHGPNDEKARAKAVRKNQRRNARRQKSRNFNILAMGGPAPLGPPLPPGAGLEPGREGVSAAQT